MNTLRRQAMAKPLPLERDRTLVPAEWIELRAHLEKLPTPHREKLLALCDRLGHFARLQTKLVRIAQDAVDQLQLDVKYLIFDLEATCRERDELQEILEEIDKEEE